MSEADAFLAAVEDFVAANRDRDTGGHPVYRWQVLKASASKTHFSLRLTFLPDQTYCCFEPGCHFGLHTAESWRRLRHLCAAQGLELPPRCAEIRLEGVVPSGARCRVGPPSASFSDVEVFQEGEACRVAKVRITGWRPGLRKVSLTEAIQRFSDLGLRESKSCTDRVLNGETVEIHVRNAEIARALVRELQALGVDAGIRRY